MAIESVVENFLFLSTGDKVGFYTLRVAVTETHYNPEFGHYTMPSSRYLKNLSTDKDTAVERATRFADGYGLHLKQDVDFDLNEIKRVQAGVRKEQRERAERERREYIEQERVKAKAIVNEGLLICGKHAGKSPAEVAVFDEQYVRWMASQFEDSSENFNPFQISANVCAIWVEANPMLESRHIGTVGEKIEVTIKVTTIRVFNERFYTVLYVGTTEEGNMVQFFTTAKAFDDVEKGDIITLNATVKEHTTNKYAIGYDEAPDCTVLNRPKMKKD